MESGAATVDPIGKEAESKADAARGRSTIEFPYMDQDAAFAVATAVHAVGGVSCDWNQLAAQMKQAPTGGGFRLRVISAKVFGLLNYERGTVTLSDLGIRAVDSKHARRARSDSFLAVPLFKAVYDKLAGSTLPPVAAIERLMEQLGVAPKQKNTARQTFIRSAKQAGFFNIDPDRLTLPPTNQHGATQPAETTKTAGGDLHEHRTKGSGDTGGGGGGGNGHPPTHPMIEGFLRELPPAGTLISDKRRTILIDAFTATLRVVYPAKDDD